MIFFLSALYLGLQQAKLWSTLSLIGTSIVLEAQPGAAASIALGFHPFMGAVISILGNLIPIPILMFTVRQIISRWGWARKKVQRAERWSRKYRRYGVGALTLLSPFLGAYLCIAIGSVAGWRPVTTFFATFLGLVVSVFLIAYGGHWLVSLFLHLT